MTRRVKSYNWEIEIDGQIIHPLTIGEWGEGEEGRIDVVDGHVKYKIGDQILNTDEVPITINITEDKYEYDILQAWWQAGTIKDIFLIGRDAAGNAGMTYIFYSCGIAMGKKSAFDRASKTAETKNYFLTPSKVDDIS